MNSSEDNETRSDLPRWDIAVIGAGLAGLSAAIEAAGHGRRVVLLDARGVIGGRARTRERHGYSLNEGAHALYVDGAAMRFLRELGCEPSGGVPDVGAGVGIDGDVMGAFPASAVSLMRTPLLKGDRSSMGKLFVKLPKMRPADYAGRSVEDAVHDLLGRGRAARLGLGLFRLSTYYHDPAVTSADAGLGQLQMVLNNGVAYLDGGWQSMVAGMEKVARDRGVEIRSATKVDEVQAIGGGHELVAGVERVRARRVVVTGSPGLAAGLLGELAPAVKPWADAARPAAVASLTVGLKCAWGDHPPFALGIDSPTYLSVHAPVADLAPPGHTLVHVMRYLSNDEPSDSDRDRAVCESLLDRVRPGWREDADQVWFSPHLVASTDQPTAATGGLAGRPPVSVPGNPDLFVAGDWVGPEGVLADGSVASGRAAGRAAAR